MLKLFIRWIIIAVSLVVADHSWGDGCYSGIYERHHPADLGLFFMRLYRADDGSVHAGDQRSYAVTFIVDSCQYPQCRFLR